MHRLLSCLLLLCTLTSQDGHLTAGGWTTFSYREWYGRFATINISKYEHFTRKINKTYSLLVRPLWFLAFSAVSSLLYHHCYSCKKGKASLKQQKSQKTKILFRVKILNSSSRNLRLLPTFRSRKNRLSFIRLTEFKQFT